MTVTPLRNTELNKWFEFFYGEQHGFVAICTKHPDSGEWSEDLFEWPVQRSEMLEHVRRNTRSHEVYFSPVLFKQPRKTKENVKGSYFVWTEFDGETPSRELLEHVPPPTIRLRSSTNGHEHWYWRLNNFEYSILDQTAEGTVENVNRRLTYFLHGDTGSWDANQVLRPPTVIHHESGKQSTTLAFDESKRYDLQDFALLPHVAAREVKLDLNKIPEPLLVIARHTWTDEDFKFFSKSQVEKGHRSSALTRLAYTCAEMGMTDEEIYSLIDNADQRWKKFVGRTDRAYQLEKLIEYVRQKYPETQQLEDEWEVYGFESFLATEKHINWMVQDVFDEGGSFLISGPPGLGKTQFSLRFAMALALGKSFIGWEVVDQQPRRVVFFSMEMAHAQLKEFIEKMAADYSNEEKARLQENLLILPIGYGIMFDQPANQARLVRFMRKYSPQGIFIDSLGVSIGDDINSAKVINDTFNFFNKLRAEFDCFTWFIHHNRKEQPNNKSPKKLSDLFGSVYIEGQISTGIGLWQPVPGGPIEVNALKVRLGPTFSTFLIQRTENLNFVSENEGPKNDTGTQPPAKPSGIFSFGGGGLQP